MLDPGPCLPVTPGAEPDGVRQGAVWNSATTPVIDLTRSPRICEFLRVHARHLILLATMTAASVPACTVETDSRRNRPNIVLIMADDLGYEALGAYGGSSYSTPMLDRLARQGIRFDHAYSQPLCTNTRVQLMTGRYQHRYWQAFGILPNRERTIGHLMQAAGYRTLIAGKWQLHSYDPVDYPGAEERRGTGMRGAESGFDEYLLWHAWHAEDKGSRYADPTFDLNGELIKEKMGVYGSDIFVDYINDFVERNRGVPFFVYYPMVLTHDPFVPTPDSPRWHDESRRHLQDPAYFADMVAYMDKLVGKIVAILDRLDLRQKTLVLFYADNGTHRSISSRLGSRMIQGGKGKTTDAGTRVPMIISWPGTVPAGVVSEDLIDSVDIYPTLAELAGTRLPDQPLIDGISFADRLLGRDGDPRNWIFVNFEPRPGWDKDKYSELTFVRDHKYKLYDNGELYDVESDVLEANPIQASVRTKMQRRITEKFQSVMERLQGRKE